MTEFLNVGKIVNTHGIRGEVRVISQTDFPEERYRKGQRLTLFRENKAPLEPLRDGILKVSKDELSELTENEYYYHEIIGLTVIDEQARELGKIKEILSPGANDVWVVQRKGKKDALIPYIESVVKQIDLDKGEVHIEIPEGLLDDED